MNLFGCESGARRSDSAEGLTRVVFGRIGSQQLGSRCKQQFGQVVGSRLFVRRGLLWVAFDIVQGMGQPNPLHSVRTFLL